MRRTRREDALRIRPLVEGLESRQFLTIGLLNPPIGVETAPLTVAPGLGAEAVVSMVRGGDPFFGYDLTLVNGRKAYAYDFTQVGRRVITGVGVEGLDLTPGGVLQLQVLTGLTSWDGRGRPDFAPVRGNVEINLNVFGKDLRVGARTDQGRGPWGGPIRRPIDVGVSDGLPLARQVEATLGAGGARNAFQRPGGPPGLYAFTASWVISNLDGIRESDPVTFVFRVGPVSDQAVDAALQAFEAPASRPVSAVAVSSEFVEPDGPERPFVRVNVEYSDPVTVSGRAPQLPIFFGSTPRMATLDPDSPRNSVTNLSFVYTPSRREMAAPSVRVGSSIRLTPGGALRSPGGVPAILSLPGATTLAVVPPSPVPPFPIPPTPLPPDPPLADPIATINADVTRNTTFRRGTTYVIQGEVRVKPGVTLTIEEGVTVLIRNGRTAPGPSLDASALIFESGSRLRAGTVYFKAADENNNEVPHANNGGVFFLGTTREATKDGVSSNTRGGRSSFTADRIVASFLGRTDPRGGSEDEDVDDDSGDDIDAISILGMGQNEWRVKAVQAEFSGDDGFDVTNSSIALDSLIVSNPVEDGVNVSSSSVEVRQRLSVVMSLSRAPDRELFDLEVDDGPARINVARRAAVDLRGYWGSPNDEVALNSPDMPSPPRRGTEDVWYEFVGTLRRGPAIIYSINAD